MTAVVDRLGQRFGRLQVFAKAGIKNRAQFWSCRCDCGSVVEVGNHSLQSGNTTSCGCSRREARPRAIKFHACRFCGGAHAAKLLARHESTCDSRPRASPRLQTDAEYLTARTRPNANGCVEWIGSTNVFGYGTCSRRGRKFLAHRLAYEAFRGVIPEDLYVCHRCDNPRCCNPEQLKAKTDLSQSPCTQWSECGSCPLI